MTKQLDVIYRSGALFPLIPLKGISEGERMSIIIHTAPVVEEAEDSGALDRAVAKMISRTPQEIEATRARLFSEMEPPRALPPGKTLEDIISGKWPGEESDEEVLQALEKLS